MNKKKITLWVISSLTGFSGLFFTVLAILVFLFLGMASLKNKPSNDVIPNGNAPVSGQALVNAMGIVSEMKKENASLQQIAGTLSNWDAESGGDPTSVQKRNWGTITTADMYNQPAFVISNTKKAAISWFVSTYPSGNYPADGIGYAGGMMQWDGPRLIGLINYAKKVNKDWWRIDTQFEYLRNADSYAPSYKKYLTQSFKTATEAAKWWYGNLEYSVGWDNAPSAGNDGKQKHLSTAEQWYNYLSGSSNSGSGGQGLSVLDKILGQALDIDGAYGAQCYDLTAYYVESISHFRPIAPNGASGLFADSPEQWTSHQWSIIKKPKYTDLKAGDVINYQPGGLVDGWYTDGEFGHTGVVGKLLGNNKYVLYEQGGGAPAHTSTYTYHAEGVASIIRPPK